MSISRKGLSTSAVAIIAAFSLTACTEDEKVSTPQTVAPITSTEAAPAPTVLETSEPPAKRANLDAMKLTKLSGKAPTKLPEWKAGGDSRAYSVEVLRFLEAAAKKSGLTTPPVYYSFYTGPQDLNLGCNRYVSMAQDVYSAVYCIWKSKAQDGVLIMPRGWKQTDPWIRSLDPTDSHPLHEILDVYSHLLGKHHPHTVHDGEARPGAFIRQAACADALIYRGMTQLDPALTNKVRSYLQPKPGDDPLPTWTYEDFNSGCNYSEWDK